MVLSSIRTKNRILRLESGLSTITTQRHVTKKKHVLPALAVPGPNKPKNLDSFMFRSFHHVSALQRENGGADLRVWDAINRETVNSRIIFLLGGADAG